MWRRDEAEESCQTRCHSKRFVMDQPRVSQRSVTAPDGTHRGPLPPGQQLSAPGRPAGMPSVYRARQGADSDLENESPG